MALACRSITEHLLVVGLTMLGGYATLRKVSEIHYLVGLQHVRVLSDILVTELPTRAIHVCLRSEIGKLLSLRLIEWVPRSVARRCQCVLYARAKAIES